MTMHKPRGEMTDLKARLGALIAGGSAEVSSSSAGGSAGSKAAKSDPIMQRRALFKTILQYMTINVDMSGLFTQMIIAATPSDLVLKKMLYLYLCTYAQQKPDLALLCINTLTKDCGDSDPTIRGLALRSLCSLRIPNLVEYLAVPLEGGLKDRDAYVRRTAALGVLKVHRMDPATVEEMGMEGKLMAMFASDADAQVVANCLTVLGQISSQETIKTQLLNKQVVYALLNRLKEFSEWSQCAVLDFVSAYRPESPDETFDIMNVLEDRLQHSNSAVVLATTKVFVQLTVGIPDVHQQVLERIKGPLYTAMHNKPPEVAYAVASHLHLLVSRAPMLFSGDYKHFFCRYNDSTSVKMQKLDILKCIADDTNAYEIVSELCEYATDPNARIARESVRAVGAVAMQLRQAEGLVERLLSFLDMQMEHITAQTYIVMADLVRCLPECAGKCVDALASMTAVDVDEPAAKAALVWILGSYGEQLQDAPYILEAAAAGFEQEAPEVQLALLTAAMKLFFKRPPECKQMLLECLRQGAQCANQDVHDRALLYFRMLRKDLALAEGVVGQVAATATPTFAEELGSEVADALFREFNTLSVLYKMPSAVFVTKDADIVYENDFLEGEEGGAEEAGAKKQGEQGAASGSAFADTNLLDLSDPGDPSPASEAPPVASDPMSLLASLGDLMGEGTASTVTHAPPGPDLHPNPQMDAALFQQLWSTLPRQQTLTLAAQAMGPKIQTLAQHMRGRKVLTIASGGQSPTFKFYQYAQFRDASQATVLVEAIANLAEGSVTCLCKSGSDEALKCFLPYLNRELEHFLTNT